MKVLRKSLGFILKSLCMGVMGILPFVNSPLAQAQTLNSTRFYCEYFVYSAPFIQLEMLQSPDGQWSPFAKVLHYGQEKEESLSVELPLGSEKHRLSLAKENPDQTIFVEIYEDLSSKLINPQVNFGKVVPGKCEISEAYFTSQLRITTSPLSRIVVENALGAPVEDL